MDKFYYPGTRIKSKNKLIKSIVEGGSIIKEVRKGVENKIYNPMNLPSNLVQLINQSAQNKLNKQIIKQNYFNEELELSSKESTVSTVNKVNLKKNLKNLNPISD